MSDELWAKTLPRREAKLIGQLSEACDAALGWFEKYQQGDEVAEQCDDAIQSFIARRDELAFDQEQKRRESGDGTPDSTK